jgi:hypothetical protein
MQYKPLNIALTAVLISLPLFVISFVISYFFTSSIKTLGFVLFVIGAIAVFFYLPGLFSKSTSGALHTPKVIYRLVGTLDRKESNTQDSDERRSHIASTLSIILAGIILWIVSFLIQN